MRQVILDTETTGLRVEEGHRIIEIGCLEMVNRKLTGASFHHYVYPEREVEAGAMVVHGITNEFLKDKPLFHQIAKELIDFINDAELIIHNAPFDLAFLNHELLLTRLDFKPITDYCKVVDTLQMARQLHPGQRNSLDALCKRYGIDLSRRELHGALVDTDLTAQVYLVMTGGQGSFFDSLSEKEERRLRQENASPAKPFEKHDLRILHASPDELAEHAKVLELLEKHR